MAPNQASNSWDVHGERNEQKVMAWWLLTRAALPLLVLSADNLLVCNTALKWHYMTVSFYHSLAPAHTAYVMAFWLYVSYFSFAMKLVKVISKSRPRHIHLLPRRALP